LGLALLPFGRSRALAFPVPAHVPGPRVPSALTFSGFVFPVRSRSRASRSQCAHVTGSRVPMVSRSHGLPRSYWPSLFLVGRLRWLVGRLLSQLAVFAGWFPSSCPSPSDSSLALHFLAPVPQLRNGLATLVSLSCRFLLV
jgi:hypothetical protein